MSRAMKSLSLLVAALAIGIACAHNSSTMGPWRSLLGDNARENWRGWKSPGFPQGWKIEGNILSKSGEVEDLISTDTFGDFEVDFDWKVSNGGNAGFFYRGTREYDRIYWSAPEYQLLDDARHPDGRNRLSSAAAAYALYAAPAGIVEPADEWNSARIVVNGARVEHWLNGQKVVEYELWSPDWKAKVAASKFKKYPNYGLAKRGHLGIQGDHAGELSIRNLRIRTSAGDSKS
jgi:hypothetical protein